MIVRHGDPHVRAALDVRTIAIVGAVGALLVAALVFVRFCGDVSLPPKPPKPTFDEAPEVVAARVGRSAELYRQTIAADAQRAGLPAPTPDEMARAFTWTSDDRRHVLRPGDPPIEVAGLRLSAISHRVEGSEPLLSLVIENPGSRPRAYVIDTRVSAASALCQNRTLLPHNGTVIAAGGREVRSECAFRRGMELDVTRVETAELTPMAAYYLSLVPSQALGADERLGGHRPALPAGVSPCNVAMSQSVRSRLEDGATRWRDLADFYARHNCASYQFPDDYQAFTTDNEHPLPAVGD